jgi:hypothetical protein
VRFTLCIEDTERGISVTSEQTPNGVTDCVHQSLALVVGLQLALHINNSRKHHALFITNEDDTHHRR